MEDKDIDTIFGEEDDDKNALAEINFEVDAGRWLLKVIGGPNNGAEFSMHAANSYVIGTDPATCDIVFHDTSVSRQHVRIAISANDEMSIEDLKSRNGTTLDGEGITGKKKLLPNLVVTLGTSSFTVYDREGEMQTIISPLLPAIVKVLQKEEPKPTDAAVKAAEDAEKAAQAAAQLAKETQAKEEAAKAAEMAAKAKEKTANTVGALIVIGIVTGLFVIIGVGTTTLFTSKPVVVEQGTDAPKLIETALQGFPGVKPYYNPTTGRLQLMGHVLSQGDKNKLMYSLQGIRQIRDLNSSGVIIDEGVSREANQVLFQDPKWKGVSIQASAPGKFVLLGYLQSRSQAEQLAEYINSNFLYLDLLENRVVVEEDLINTAMNLLRVHQLNAISPQMSNGVLSLNGRISKDQQEVFQNTVEELKKIPGIRDVKSFVVELAPDLALVNISDKYEVTGISKRGNVYSVVIHGHILSKGDELDGMTVKEIRPNAVLLEKDGVKYRIDFSR